MGRRQTDGDNRYQQSDQEHQRGPDGGVSFAERTPDRFCFDSSRKCVIGQQSFDNIKLKPTPRTKPLFLGRLLLAAFGTKHSSAWKSPSILNVYESANRKVQ